VTTASEAGLLASTEKLLRAVADEVPTMRKGMLAYLQGGKRLRASLLLAIGARGERPNVDTLMRYATFVELIHAGGLCHDDVVDRSATRRGRPSIGHLYGAPVAAAGGLYLMARALQMVATEDHRVRSWVADVAGRVARGQAREMTDLYQEDVPIGEHLERVSDKTAALFELAARLGAVGGGYDEAQQEALASYGTQVGLAFQLADDLRDIIGGPTLGRERGTDIREGVYTLPVLLTLAERRSGWDRLRRMMRSARSCKNQATVDACCEIVLVNGAVSAAAGVMRDRLEEAVSTAERLPSRLRPVLRALAKRVEHGLDHVLEVVA
jgi:geranylgeranyl pyrophosphate synthase